MNRASITPENSAISTLNNIQQQLDAIKQPQSFSSSGICMPPIQTDSAYDHSASIPSGGTHTFTVAFNLAHQTYAVSDITYQVYKDSMANLVPLWNGGGFQPSAGVGAVPGSVLFYISVQNGDSVPHTYYLKYYVQSTDSGTVQPL